MEYWTTKVLFLLVNSGILADMAKCLASVFVWIPEMKQKYLKTSYWKPHNSNICDNFAHTKQKGKWIFTRMKQVDVGLTKFKNIWKREKNHSWRKATWNIFVSRILITFVIRVTIPLPWCVLKRSSFPFDLLPIRLDPTTLPSIFSTQQEGKP